MTIKTLILDIETKPATAYVWGLWDQNIGLHQIVENDGILCWGAAWVGTDYTLFSSVNMTSERNMLKEIWNLLDEADEVVGWNSDRFDIKWLNGQFALQGWGPPSPYKKVDLCKAAKKNFRMLSNKLDHYLTRFGLENKVKHDGFELWVGCMNGDAESWRLMEEYNIGDVLRTEEMYHKLRPWLSGTINRSSVLAAHVCPECGGVHLQSRGYARTTTLTYRRWQCNDCGKWSRSRMPEKSDNSSTLIGIQ